MLQLLASTRCRMMWWPLDTKGSYEKKSGNKIMRDRDRRLGYKKSPSNIFTTIELFDMQNHNPYGYSRCTIPATFFGAHFTMTGHGSPA